MNTAAINLINSKRFSEAVPVLQSLLTLDPYNGDTLYALGICYASLKKYPEAIDAYTRALDLRPNDADLWNHRGVAYYEFKKYREASDDFNKALSINPDLAVAQKNLQNAQKKLKPISIFGLAIIIVLVFFGKIIVVGAINHSTQSTSISQAIDYRDTTTINYARELVQKSNSGNYNLAQVCDIWEYIYKNWKYVNDPNGPDYYSPASNTVKNGLTGDCDDFAILISAMVESIGGTSRVVTATNDKGEGHAYAEVYVGESLDDVQKARDYICSRYSCDDTGNEISYSYNSDATGITRYWLNLDWSAGHPGGQYTATNNKNPFYPAGDWDYVPLPVPTVTPDLSALSKIAVIPTSTQLSGLSSIYPITIINKPLVEIPYKTFKGWYFNGNSGNVYQISISASDPVDVLILDQKNFNIYQNGFESRSAVHFTSTSYKSIKSKEITYVMPNTDTYYVVIENADSLVNGADAKTSVIASIKISNTG